MINNVKIICVLFNCKFNIFFIKFNYFKSIRKRIIIDDIMYGYFFIKVICGIK